MLANNHIIKVQSQNFTVAERVYFNDGLYSPSCQFILTLRTLFQHNREVQKLFATETFKILSHPCNISEKDLDDYDMWEQMAIYGVFLSSLVFGYDTQEEVPAKRLKLYTSSVSVLKSMIKDGILKGKKEPIEIEIDSIEKTLYQSRLKNTFKKEGNKIACVRLDFELQGSKLVYTPTIVRSALEMGRFVFIPFQTYYEACTLFEDVLRTSILRVTCGDKVRAVTLNESVLNMIYGEVRTKQLVNGSRDIRSLRFYVPSVGASIYTAGVTNLRLVDVDKIEKLDNITQLDLSELKLNYSMVNQFFDDNIAKASDETIQGLITAFDLNVETSVKRDERIDILIKAVHARPSHTVYDELKKYPTDFDLKAYASLPCKYGEDYIPVTVPTKKEDFDKLMQAGVFKVLISKRDGSNSTVVCTQSDKELQRVLGNDYIKTYESAGVRLRALKKLAIAGQVTDVDASCKEWHLEELLEGVPDKSVDTLLGRISEALYDVEVNKTVIKQPHLSTVRCLEARVLTDGTVVDYYKNIDLASVLDIVCLHK